MSSLLSGLSASQARAVQHPGGPLLVVAGPGTGKTRTLTRRIAYLVRERGVDPGTVAAITFTQRAAREMRERLRELLEGEAFSKCFIGTFHALGLLIVREEAKALGFQGEPVLYGEEDRSALLKEVLREIRPKEGRIPAEQVYAAIESALNRMLTIEGVEEGYDLKDVHLRYECKKQAEGALDFNDLLLLPIRLFQERLDRRDAYQRRFRHFFVDEYQDVNAPQVLLVRILTGRADSLMAIGDPDQAIYSFRGSDVRNFLNFPKDFSNAEVLKLEENYRSSVTIVNASDQVIRRNENRLPDTTPARSAGEEGLLLALHVLATERMEASFVARRIEQLAGGMARYGLESGDLGTEEEEEFGFGDMAVLYRLNAQATRLGEALDKAGIPWQQVGTNRSGKDPYERLILAAARLSVNPASRAAWRLLESMKEGRKLSKDEVMENLAPDAAAGSTIFHQAGRIIVRAMPKEADALMNAAQRLADRAVREGTDPEAYLRGAPLTMREDPFEARSERVTLSTLHAAKGLEFPVVFIAGLEEGIMPFLRGDEDDPRAALEEERRLLYVGMTRAKARLFLLRTQGRMLFGKRLKGVPSPFLEDISEDLVQFVREKVRPPKKPREKGEGSDGQGMLF